MNINSERLWSNIHELGQIGRTAEGGITRLSFTETEAEAKNLVRKYMEAAGLQVEEDAIGNMIGRKNGTLSDAPAIVIGSHIDSVFNGGIFDGPAGVLTGIEVLNTMNEEGIETKYPIEVIAFTDEEGARFSSGMLGSKALVGSLKDKELFEYVDQNGLNIAEAMEKAGYDYRNIDSVKRKSSELKQYIELHIEQGKVLESNKLPVGVVTGIVGMVWLKVTLQGEAGHAGTTPMYLRKDPLAAAATILNYSEQLATNEKHTVATVGRINVKPGGINIIPREVEFTIDIRDLSDDNLERIESQVRDYINITCQDRGIKYEIEVLHRLPSAQSSSTMVHLVKEAMIEEQLTPFELASGAGHDAMVLAGLTEMVMIFVRSKDGISHNPKEWTEREDIAIGAQVLYRSVLKMTQDN
jgi:allantoate deiminase